MSSMMLSFRVLSINNEHNMTSNFELQSETRYAWSRSPWYIIQIVTGTEVISEYCFPKLDNGRSTDAMNINKAELGQSWRGRTTQYTLLGSIASNFDPLVTSAFQWTSRGVIWTNGIHDDSTYVALRYNKNISEPVLTVVRV